MPWPAIRRPERNAGTANKQADRKKTQILFRNGCLDDYFSYWETNLGSVYEIRVDGAIKSLTTHYSVNLVTGLVTFTSAVALGTNNVEIRYSKGTGDRGEILKQRYSETYNGYTDNRVFLYGDGTNHSYYSDLEYETGLPTAEYFPDLNVLDAGESGTPIKSMIRHYNRLLIFKSDSAYSAYYDSLTLADGTTTAGFYIRAINKEIGHTPYGQVQLVNNNPYTLDKKAVYEWKQEYSSTTRDERNARAVSDRVMLTLSGFDFNCTITYDDQERFEYWAVCNDTAVVHNYLNDSWCIYTNIPARCFIDLEGELYFGSPSGKLMHISSEYRSDDGASIDCYWESGSMAFGEETMYKAISDIYTSIKPEAEMALGMAVMTEDRCGFEEKEIFNTVFSFAHLDFSHFCFITRRRAKIIRTRLRASKFVFMKIIFQSNSASSTATLLSASLPIVSVGQVK